MEICKDCKKSGAWTISIQNGLNHFYLCSDCKNVRAVRQYFTK